MNDLTGFKERLKDVTDCRDLFRMHNVEMKKATATTAKCCCPFHNEKTPSCVVYPDHFYCYGCQTGGDVFDAVMKFRTVDFMDAMRALAEMAGLELPAMNPKAAEEARIQRDLETWIFEIIGVSQAFYRDCLENQPVGKSALKYCQARGITKDLREKFGIGYAPDDRQIEKVLKVYDPKYVMAAGITGESNGFVFVRMRDRLTFAISDHRGRLCGFSGRRMVDEQPEGSTGQLPAKYLNTPQTPVFDKGRLFFGWIQAVDAIGKTRTVTLCEGQTDVLACHKAGITNAVAAMGTAFTGHHAALIRRHADNAIMCMDGDTAGIAATLKAIQLLNEKREGTE